MDTREKNFEADIESYLFNHGGYFKGNQETKGRMLRAKEKQLPNSRIISEI